MATLPIANAIANASAKPAVKHTTKNAISIPTLYHIRDEENVLIQARNLDLSTLSGNYSTEEINTGYTWINGKDIYKKTYTGTVGARDKAISFGFTPAQIIKIEGGINDATYGFQPWQRALINSTEQSAFGVQIGDMKNSFHIQLGSSLATSTTYFLTIYYTKN